MGNLGRYQLIGRLATGGMAEIYLALAGELSGYRTMVVVKRILPHLAVNDQFVRMFLDEARIEARLDHPNVVRIIEVGHDGDEYFLAMELVQGKPLSTVLRRATREKAPLLHPLAAYIVAQAANGLGYAHNLIDSEGRPFQIVHRDVSPQNILVSFEGAVKIIDFGIARATGRGTHTNPGGLKGKIQYMSPEQASASEVDPRSDVFALGVVLWEVLVGQRLFYRDNELAMMRAVVEEPIPSPSQLVQTPPELEAIVMRALDRDPARRYHTAQEMALALERFAFANGSFSPQQLSTYMKLLFAGDYLQWKRTVSTAMEMETERRAADSSADLLTQSSTDHRSSGATLELRPAQPENIHEAGGPEGSVETPIFPPAVSRSPPSLPTVHDRLWVYGGIASLAMISIAGVLVLSQPRNIRRNDTIPTATLVKGAAGVGFEPPLAIPMPAADAAPPAPIAAVASASTVPGIPPAPVAILPAVLPALPPAGPPVAGPPGPVATALPVRAPAPSAPSPAPGPSASAPDSSSVASRTPSPKRSIKEQRAQRARTAKLSPTGAARSRRLSLRDVGRSHAPKRQVASTRANRLQMDDLPLPLQASPAPTPVRQREEAPAAPFERRRNPFN